MSEDPIEDDEPIELTGRKRVIFAIVLLGVVSVFGALIGEVALRVFGFGRPLRFEYHDDYIYRMVPNQSAYAPNYGVTFEVNSKGLRDTEFENSKPAGELRILALGDSNTAGQGVVLDETFVKRLEHRLVQSRGQRPAKVINAGVPGYNLYNEFRFLESAGFMYEPDMILLGLSRNDFGVNSSVGEMRERARSLEAATGSNSAWVHLLKGFWKYKTYLINRVGGEGKSLAVVGGPVSENAWRDTAGWLREIARVSAENKIPLVVVALPQRDEMASKTSWERMGDLERLARKEGFLLVDMHAPLVEGGGAALFIDGAHPSSEGHAIIAGVVFQFLKSKGLFEL